MVNGHQFTVLVTALFKKFFFRVTEEGLHDEGKGTKMSGGKMRVVGGENRSPCDRGPGVDLNSCTLYTRGRVFD